MTDENRNQDPKNVPGQRASDPKPSDKPYDKTYAGGSGGSQTPNQGSRPGSPKPGVSDDDANIREPKTGDDDESKRGGMGRDRDTDPDEPGAGGMGGTRGGMGGPGGAEDR
jgi:hypothetical protein